MRLVNQKSINAFSLTELLESLGIASIIGVVIVFMYAVGSEDRKIDKGKLQLSLQADAIAASLRDAINGTVRTHGFSTSAGSSYGNFLIPLVERDSGTDAESLFILSEKHADISATIDGISTASGVTRMAISQPDAGVEPLKERMQRALRTYLEQTGVGVPILIHTPSETNLIRMGAGMQASAWTVPIVLSGFLQPDTTNPRDPLEIQRLLEQGARISMLSRMEVVLENNQLKVRERFAGNTRESIIGTNVQSINFRYTFSGYHRPANSNLIIPPQATGSPDLSDFVSTSCSGSDCCNPETQNCAEQGDLSAVVVSMKVRMPFNANKSFDHDTEGYTLSAGSLTKEVLFSIFPKNYNSRLENVTQAVGLECRDPRERCKPGCAATGYFNEANVNSVRWEGYGRYVGTSNPLGASDYCSCGTDINGIFSPPETYPSDLMGLRYNPEAATAAALDANRRLNACVAHFDEYAPWAFMHPYPWMFFNFFGEEARRLFRTGSRGSIVYNRDFLESYRTNYETYGINAINDPEAFWDDDGRVVGGTATRRIMNCRLNWDGNSAFYRWIWSNSYNLPVPGGRNSSPIILGQQRPGDEACACRTDIGNLFMDYVGNHYYKTSVANHDTLACPNTAEDIDPDSWPVPPSGTPGTAGYNPGSKVYKVNGPGVDDYKDGFQNVADAAIPECLDRTYPDKVNVPVSHGWAISLLWDFRAGGSIGTTEISPATLTALGYPALPASYGNGHPNSANPYTTVGRTVTVNYKQSPSGSIQSSSVSCVAADRWGAFSRCLDGRTAFGISFNKAAVLTNLVTLASSGSNPELRAALATPALRDSWANWCNPACARMPYDIPANYANFGVDNLRRFLTDVGPNNPIPSWCGGIVQDARPGF